MGLEIRRMTTDLGRSAYADMKKLAILKDNPVIVDVGANVGQSIEQFRAIFQNPEIHAFEPSPRTFDQLKARTGRLDNLNLHNMALGAAQGSLKFSENSDSVMSSFLEPDRDCWGEVQARYDVRVETLDRYCELNNISSIEVVKLDTQGFDYEVLKGAKTMLDEHRIHLIFTEIIFDGLYKGHSRLDQIYGFLVDRGYALVSFYQFYYRRERASWTDALFIHPSPKN